MTINSENLCPQWLWRWKTRWNDLKLNSQTLLQKRTKNFKMRPANWTKHSYFVAAMWFKYMTSADFERIALLKYCAMHKMGSLWTLKILWFQLLSSSSQSWEPTYQGEQIARHRSELIYSSIVHAIFNKFGCEVLQLWDLTSLSGFDKRKINCIDVKRNQMTTYRTEAWGE